MYLEISNPMDYHVALYIRLSKEDENEGPSQSVQNQESLLREFVQQHRLSVFDTYVDDGWSGTSFDRSSFQRMIGDIETKKVNIIDIRSMAERKEFDVLLVFMFDRLGRRDDETPFLVEWFINQGIEVWSTREGQQKLENRGDKLINYIRFWMAGGESEKTSLRVKAAHVQMTEDGLWRGGGYPFGYKLVRNGRMGKKNRPLYDLIIDEEKGPIVQELFDLLTSKGYGTLRAANEMNRRYPNPDKVWTAQTVRNMIRNPTYTGRLHMNDLQSQPIESLRLVSDADFSFAQYCLQARIPHKYREIRETENGSVPVGQTKASIYGATLLSGLVYCAHCGCRLVGGYCTKQRKHHAYHRPIYRCYNGAVKAKNCGGQSVYSALKLEEAVLEVVRSYFDRITGCVSTVWQEQVRQQLRKKHGTAERTTQMTLESLLRDEANLHAEILKSFNGESKYPADTLALLLESTEQKIVEARNRLEQIRIEGSQENARALFLSEQFDNITSWGQEFDSADTDRKKMILARLIEKITIDRNYHITINFYISFEDFANEVNNLSTNLTVKQSDRFIEAAV